MWAAIKVRARRIWLVICRCLLPLNRLKGAEPHPAPLSDRIMRKSRQIQSHAAHQVHFTRAARQISI
jgi:hypothetical protein